MSVFHNWGSISFFCALHQIPYECSDNSSSYPHACALALCKCIHNLSVQCFPTHALELLEYMHDRITVRNGATGLLQIWSHCPEYNRAPPTHSRVFNFLFAFLWMLLMKETVAVFYFCLSSPSVPHTRHSRMCSRSLVQSCKHGLPSHYHQNHVLHKCEKNLDGLSCLHDSQDIAI